MAEERARLETPAGEPDAAQLGRGPAPGRHFDLDGRDITDAPRSRLGTVDYVPTDFRRELTPRLADALRAPGPGGPGGGPSGGPRTGDLAKGIGGASDKLAQAADSAAEAAQAAGRLESAAGDISSSMSDLKDRLSNVEQKLAAASRNA